MTLEEKLRLSYYKYVSTLNEEHGVMLVRHAESGCIFVMKRLTTFDPEVICRLKEAKLPGLPVIYEAVEDDGVMTVVEQYIDGEPLSSRIRRDGPFDEDEALLIAKRLCAVLHSLHIMEPPIIHRDIKPSNVLLGEDGSVTLIDIDAAKQFKTGESRDTELIGTEDYAAPEQYGFGASSPETDIYAFGVLLNVMLTGKLPREKAAGGRLGRIIEKCTDFDRAKRYRSAKELLHELNKVGGKPVKVKGGMAYSRYRPLGFRTLTPWKMLLALLGYAGIVFMSFSFSFDGTDPKKLLSSRIWFCITMFILVLFPSDFCGILEIMGIKRIKSTVARVLVIILLEVIMLMVFISVFSRI